MASNEKTIPYYRLFTYSTSLDKACIVIASVCSIICGITQPYIMVLFGTITGSIVEYVEGIKNVTLNETDKFLLTEMVINEGQLFAIKTTIVGIIAMLTTYISSVLFNISCMRQIFKMRKIFLEKTLNQDIEWFDMNQTGDFATSFTENISKIEEGIGEKIGMFMFFESTFVAGIIMAFAKGWKLALVCLISLPLSSALMGIITWSLINISANKVEMSEQ